MKKLLFTLMATTLLAAPSCKKCGYCHYNNGQGNGTSVCKNNTLGAFGLDDYNQKQSQCQADGGNWVVTK